jgi:hypothetical protein
MADNNGNKDIDIIVCTSPINLKFEQNITPQIIHKE